MHLYSKDRQLFQRTKSWGSKHSSVHIAPSKKEWAGLQIPIWMKNPNENFLKWIYYPWIQPGNELILWTTYSHVQRKNDGKQHKMKWNGLTLSISKGDVNHIAWIRIKHKQNKIIHNSLTRWQNHCTWGRTKCLTSYVNVPPEESGWRSVTLEITPLAERMHIARGPCWENDMTFIVTS